MSNKLGPELGANAQRVIADARGFDDPTSEDRDRVRARWLATIAAGAGVSALSGVARAGTTSLGWGLKAAGLALAVATGAVGLYLFLPAPDALGPASLETKPSAAGLPESASADSEASTAKRAVPAGNPATEPAAPAELAEGEAAKPRAISAESATGADREQGVRAEPPASPELPPTPRLEAAGRAPAPVVHGMASKPVAVKALPEPAPTRSDESGLASNPNQAPVPIAASGQLGEEIGLLSRIRGSVREGAGARALDLLADYQGRFERPILGMEAAALRVDALCQSGQPEAARAAAEVFRNNWPASPLEQRVSSACP